ncbi:MAG: hypothetical protein AAGK21_15855, partial [Bacteroidota bacterium]
MRTRYEPRAPHAASLLGLTALFLALAFSAPAEAQPVKYFGQDAPPDAMFNINNATSAVAARNRFTANLTGVQTVAFTGGATGTTPGRNGPTTFNWVDLGVFNFTGQGGSTIPTRVETSDGEIRATETFGAYATSASSFVYGVGYDDGVGQTAGGIRLTYVPSTNTRPFGAFGAYITDIEGFGGVSLTLTPEGGGTPVVLRYTGIKNEGVIETSATQIGNGNTIFVGFIDTETRYTRIQIGFDNPSGQQANESFGLDDLTIGEPLQLAAGKDQATVTQAAACDDAGWRLLSAPVDNGVTPNSLGLLNLIQGIPAGAGITQQQYPLADGTNGPTPNFYNEYGGGGAADYAQTASAGTVLEPGRGFWWYWFDQNIDPDDDAFGGGTSESFVLDNFYLSAIGDELTANINRNFAVNSDPGDDDFYLAGNPYSVPYDVTRILGRTGGTTNSTTIQQCVLVWDPCDPGGATYKPIEFDGSSGPTVIAPWQGFIIQATTTGTQVRVRYRADGRDPNATPTFVGRRAEEPRLALELRGTTASGAAVQDLAAVVRVVGDADDAWDAYDFSK